MENSIKLDSIEYSFKKTCSAVKRERLMHFSTLLVFLIIMLTIIPVGKSSIFPIAPINLFFVLVLMYIIGDTKQLSIRLNKYVCAILLTYLLYQILVYFLYLHKYGDNYSILQSCKSIIIVLAFTTILNSRSYYFLFKAFTAFIFISMLYGFLIYYFGEPFASIRMTILGNANEYLIYFGKGDRLVGFDNKIFLFGYLLAILPVLLLTLYKIKKHYYLLVFIAIAVIGIILNGERAAMLSSFVVLIVLVKKWYPGKKVLVLFGVIFVLIILFDYFLLNITTEELVRLSTQKNEGEIPERITRQVAGMLSVLKTPLVGSYIDNYHSIFMKRWDHVPSSVHNAYINIGVYGGIFGWLLFWIFGRNIFKLSKIMKVKMMKNDKSSVLYQGIISAFIAALLVGLTHNNGIFFGENASIILLGFIISGASISFSKSLSSNINHK